MLLQLGQAIGNVPFDPARATASAIFSGPDALGQLWLFWVAPVVGAAIAGLVFRGFAQSTGQTAPGSYARSDTRPAGDKAADTELDGAELNASELDAAELDAAELDGVCVDTDTGATAARRSYGKAPAEDEARSFFDRKGGK